MNITVVGTGYVGLVTGTCFADKGHEVTCVDIDKEKVVQMQKGNLPIYEPGLKELFLNAISKGKLTFTSELKEGVKNAEIIFLALPTPPGEDGSADLSYILNVAKELGSLLNQYAVVVNKSTVPVGTAEKVYSQIAQSCKSGFDVVSNPEFLREGLALEDFMTPERVVVGTSSKKAQQIMEKLYAPFLKEGSKLIFMDEKSAEMTKYAANSFLALKISFMNQLANLCEKAEANIDKVKEGIGSDSRIGNKFLNAGIGYGGSCFPKDVKALNKTSNEYNYDFSILNSVMEANEKQKLILLPRIKTTFQDQLKGKTIAIWGLAFKPDTDDIRESAALCMIDELLKEACLVKVYDPEAMGNVRKIYGNKLHYGESKYEVVKEADALVICTEWPEFYEANLTTLSLFMNRHFIFDGRNIFDPELFTDTAFHYESIGRKTNKGNKDFVQL